MLTLLTQLELGEVQYLHLLPELNVTCILNFHNVGSMFRGFYFAKINFEL